MQRRKFLDICSGIAKSKKEAWEIFDDLLDAMYIKYLEGKTVGQYAKRGRPAKNRIDVHAQVQLKTKRAIDKIALAYGISKGEAIDMLAFGSSISNPFGINIDFGV